MSTLIEVAISLAFIFLIFSIIVSGCCELWQMATGKRGCFLYRSLDSVFNDKLNKDYAFLLLSHPLIDNLRESDTEYPHYIAAGTFADALIDVIRCDHLLPEYNFDKTEKRFVIRKPPLTPPRDGNGSEILGQYLDAVEHLNESDLSRLLRTFALGADDYSTLRKNITRWFTHYMDATSGWYKKQVTRALLIFAAFITVPFNVDSIHLTKQLFADKSLRERVVQDADAYVRRANTADSASGENHFARYRDSTYLKRRMERQVERLKQAYGEAGLLDLPIGWPMQDTQNGWFMVFGWLITIGAISYGADNWFNLLVRFLNIRTSVKPKDTNGNPPTGSS